MQRPCYALAVLLGSIASSMLMVSTVNSQSPVIAVLELPGPQFSAGDMAELSAISVVLGQSVDNEVDGWSVQNGGTDLVASDVDGQRDIDSSLAQLSVGNSSQGFWSTLLSKGYDIAYDYAMLGSRYIANTANVRNGEYPVALEQPEMLVVTEINRQGAAATAPVSVPAAAPASVPPCCEDNDDCFVWDCEAPVQHSSSGIARGLSGITRGLTNTANVTPCIDACETDVCEENPCVDEICEDEFCDGCDNDEVDRNESEDDYCLPVLLPEECTTWLWNGIEKTGSWTADQLNRWWTIAQTLPWIEQFQDEWSNQVSNARREVDLDDLFGPSIPTTPVAVEVETSYDEEVLLIIAANSLDRLGTWLQNAADQLRTVAADRIVFKANSRKLANKPSN